MTLDDTKNKIVDIVRDLLGRIGFEGDVKFADNDSNEGKFSVVSIESDKDLSMLIGKNGQNLSALDHVVKLLVARKLANSENNSPANFIVDINDYRKERANYLIDGARSTARRVAQTRRAEALAPMSSYERRLIHTELASFQDIQTESIGQEPYRRVVIKPTLVL